MTSVEQSPILPVVRRKERWVSLDSFGYPKHRVSENGQVKNNNNKTIKRRYLGDGSCFVTLTYYTKYC